MKVIRHFTAATTGRIDTGALCRRMAEFREEVEVSEITTFSGAQAPLFKSIFRGDDT